MNKVPYIREINIYDYGIEMLVRFCPLNPTGRWKLVTTPFSSNRLFIEHKQTIFRLFTVNQWIPEENIKFVNKPEEFIFDCRNNN